MCYNSILNVIIFIIYFLLFFFSVFLSSLQDYIKLSKSANNGLQINNKKTVRPSTSADCGYNRILPGFINTKPISETESNYSFQPVPLFGPPESHNQFSNIRILQNPNSRKSSSSSSRYNNKKVPSNNSYNNPGYISSSSICSTPGDIHSKSVSSSSVDFIRVMVFHIVNPSHFYVKFNATKSSIDNLQKACLLAAQTAKPPKSIDINQIYLIQNNQKWLRGKVLKTEKKKHLIFYIDFGREEYVQETKIREISTNLIEMESAAILCSFYNIAPIDNVWNDEAKQLMMEIITKQNITMLICNEGCNDASPYTVDLIASNDNPTSVRDALIYHGYANNVVPVNIITLKKIRFLTELKDKHINRNKKSFTKYTFSHHQKSSDVCVINAMSPDEFYVMQQSHVKTNDEFQTQFNEFYNQDNIRLRPVFLPRVNLICACRYRDKWYRARIVKVLTNGILDVWLVDIGETVNVNWRCLRHLDNLFVNAHEAVILCGLSDIVPISKTSKWTLEAIENFRLLCQSANLRMFVSRYVDRRYEVCLFIKKQNVDICVNGALVKNNHARSTGVDSENAEFGRVSNDDDIIERTLSNDNVEQQKPPLNSSGAGATEAGGAAALPPPPPTSADESPKKLSSSSVRTMVEVLHVVTPSEFYVSISRQIPSLQRFQHEIQSVMGNFVPSSSNFIWNTGDNCFVRTTIPSANTKSWYRGYVLESTSDQNCTVFLKDYGYTVTVSTKKLAPIDANIANLNNGALQCHLACVKQTGDSNAWPLTSIDQLKMAVTKFDAIAISQQGERKTGHNGDSVSVILWGMLNDGRDPYAPTYCEWTNINKVMVNRGYCYLTEQFLPLSNTRSMEKKMKHDLNDLTNWLNEKVDMLNDECNRKLPSVQSPTLYDIELNTDILPISEWLPAVPVKKTIFNAIPTYVDNNGIIYMHEVETAKFLKQMQYVINKRYDVNNADTSTAIYFAVGQPCLAKFRDHNFYRGLILEKSLNKYQVSIYRLG